MEGDEVGMSRSIKLVVHVEHLDGEFTVERDAPELPESVKWHSGMIFIDLEVDYIRADRDGNCEVVFSECYQSNVSKESLAEFTDDGWNVRRGIKVWSRV